MCPTVLYSSIWTNLVMFREGYQWLPGETYLVILNIFFILKVIDKSKAKTHSDLQVQTLHHTQLMTCNCSFVHMYVRIVLWSTIEMIGCIIPIWGMIQLREDFRWIAQGPHIVYGGIRTTSQIFWQYYRNKIQLL